MTNFKIVFNHMTTKILNPYVVERGLIPASVPIKMNPPENAFLLFLLSIPELRGLTSCTSSSPSVSCKAFVISTESSDDISCMGIGTTGSIFWDKVLTKWIVNYCSHRFSLDHQPNIHFHLI